MAVAATDQDQLEVRDADTHSPGTTKRLVAWVKGRLPEGRALPEEIWTRRHRGILTVLWLHVPAIFLFGMIRGVGPTHSLLEASAVAAFALAASVAQLNRTVRASFVTLGLLSASGILVHLSGGTIEMHFHFFVMLGVIALYQDWFVYLLAVGFVALHHGTIGVLDPEGVYNHPSAREHPWTWAGIHAVFVLGLSVANVVAWRLNEKYRAQADRARQQEAVAELSRRALSASSFIDLTGEAVRILTETLGIESAGVLELVPEHDAFRLRAGAGWSPDALSDTVLAADGPIRSGDWLASGEPLVVNDAASDPRFAGSPAVEDEFASGIFVVVPGPDAPYGVLGVHTKSPRTFDHQDVNFLEAVANTLGGALRQKRAEEQLLHQALHDPLTDLANRALFKDRVEHALARTQRTRGKAVVLFLDLDDFKGINDSLGHASGDELLASLAERLRGSLRPADTIARLGGDEFAILLEDVENIETARLVAERLLDSLREPFFVTGKEVFVRTSIGIAPADQEAGVDSLMRDADVAMYVAKADGKGRYEVFQPDMHDAVVRRLALEEDLRRAVERGEFSLHYQPSIDLQTRQIVGMEALIRWNHPKRGLVSPAEFISVAEETGLIVPIGSWVLEEACRQARVWQDAYPLGHPLKVSVNVSPRQFQEASFVGEVTAILDRTGLDPTSLILEITEGVVMHDVEATVTKLEQLKHLGVSIAVDDFGTGYSSLAYLRRFPIDILKIDRSFVSSLEKGPEDRALTQAIIKLSQSLRLQTVAEGIEGPVELSKLRELGCQEGQGYYFSRPLPSEELERLLAGIQAGDTAFFDPEHAAFVG